MLSLETLTEEGMGGARFAVVVAAAAAIVIVWRLLWRWFDQRRQFVRAANALPGLDLQQMHWLWGHSGSLLRTIGTVPGHPELPNTLQWYLERLPAFRDAGLMRVWFLHPYHFATARASVSIIHPALIRQLLLEKSHALGKEPRVYTINRSLVGASFLAEPDGPVWKHQRKLAAPAFSAALQERVHATVGRLLQTRVFPKWDDNKQTTPIVLEAAEWSASLTMDVLGWVAFSQSCGALQDWHDKQQKQHAADDSAFQSSSSKSLHSAFVTILDTLAVRVVSLPFRQYLPTRENWAFRQATRHLDAAIRRILQARLLKPPNEGETKEDILDYLLQRDAATGQRQLSDSAIFANVRMLLFAGHDTTASVVAWALHEVATRPAVQHQLQAELDQLPLSSSEPPTFKQLSSQRLPYLDAVVRETLRLHAPGPVARVATQDIELTVPAKDNTNKKGTKEGGPPQKMKTYLIPQGAKVFMLPLFSHHLYADGSVDDAALFRPERFFQTNGSSSASEWYLPFSVGPRNCVGQPMAVAELKSILYHVLTRYQLTAYPEKPPPIHMLATTAKPNQVWVQLTKRKGR